MCDDAPPCPAPGWSLKGRKTDVREAGRYQQGRWDSREAAPARGLFTLENVRPGPRLRAVRRRP